MSMPIKPRDSYSKDVASLNRIAAAVRDDDRLSLDTREKIVEDLYRAIKRLLAVEASTLGSNEEKTAPAEFAHEEVLEDGESAPSES